MESKMIWGLVFITIGILMLVNYVFGIHLPIFRVLFSLFVIYLGLNMLFGAFNLKVHRLASDDAAIFSSSTFQFDLTDGNKRDSSSYDKEFKTVFGEGTLDLSDVQIGQSDVDLSVKTVFGQTLVYLKKGTPFRVHTKTVFGNTELPGKNQSVIGKFNYQSENLRDQDPALNIDAEVVFGSLVVVER